MGRRDRPGLKITLHEIAGAVRRHRNVMAAARELGCSDAYIHAKFRRYGLTLEEVLEAGDAGTLLKRMAGPHEP